MKSGESYALVSCVLGNAQFHRNAPYISKAIKFTGYARNSCKHLRKTWMYWLVNPVFCLYACPIEHVQEGVKHAQMQS